MSRYSPSREVRRAIYGRLARATFRNPAFTAPTARVFFPPEMSEDAKRVWLLGRWNSHVWHLGGRSASVA